MTFIQSFLIAIGLAADAFAVSITNGLSAKELKLKKALQIALSFGIFQAMMPLMGFLVGRFFTEIIERFDHYIALLLLGFIGGKMLYGAISELRHKKQGADASDEKPQSLSFGALMLQSVATSIDALVVGIGFIAMRMTVAEVVAAVVTIGAVTFVTSLIGVYAGKKFGEMLGHRAELIGGIILIGIGVKIFIEHTFLQ